jgi:hypothetical protein
MKKQDIGVPFGHIWASVQKGSRHGRVLVQPYSRANRHIRPLVGRYSSGAFDLQTIPASVKMLGLQHFHDCAGRPTHGVLIS